MEVVLSMWFGGESVNDFETSDDSILQVDKPARLVSLQVIIENADNNSDLTTTATVKAKRIFNQSQ